LVLRNQHNGNPLTMNNGEQGTTVMRRWIS
jgi:hypothetical protein